MEIKKYLRGVETFLYQDFNTLGSVYNLEKTQALKYMDYYNNNQKQYLKKPSGMSPVKWASLPKIVVPKCNTIIDRIVDWLLDDYKYESKNYMSYNKESFIRSFILLGLVQGVTYIRADYNDIDKNFLLSTFSVDNSIMMYDSNGNSIGWMSQYRYENRLEYSKGEIQVNEFITDYSIRKLKTVKEYGRTVILSDVEVENPYGRVNVLPIYYRKQARGYYGTSYLKGIADLNTELNEIYSGISRILKYHSAPLLVIQGAKKNNLTVGVDRILYLPENAEVDYLTWDQNIGAYETQKKDIEGLISELSGIPSSILTTDVPSGLSSLSLKVLYSPVVSMISKQKTFWEAQFMNLINFLSILDPLHRKNDVKLELNKDIIPVEDNEK